MNSTMLKVCLQVILAALLSVSLSSCSSSEKKANTEKEEEVIVPFEKGGEADKYTYDGDVVTEKEQGKLDQWLSNHSQKAYQNNPPTDLYEGEGAFEVTAEMETPVKNRAVTFTVAYDYLLKYKGDAWHYTFTNIVLNQSENGLVSNTLEQFVEQYEAQGVLNAGTSDYLTSLYAKIDSAFKERIEQLK